MKSTLILKRRQWLHTISGPTLLMALYFVSGACSLIDEVIWARLLKLSLGHTVYASGIVVSVFMGGLALGSWIMGRRCHGVRRPLLSYALIEGMIALIVLASPRMIAGMDWLYVRFWRLTEPTHSASLLIQTLLTGSVLLIPTVLMGSTLPLLARTVTAIEKETGPMVGRLYACNVLGAATGCFMAGFILIRLIGVTGTLTTSVILNFLVAAGAYGLHWRLAGRRLFGDVSCQSTIATEDTGLSPVSVTERWLAAAFFLSGFVCIGYELLWIRSIVHTVGAFTYAFSAVLTVYLLGNVMGTALGSHVVRRVDRPGAAYAVVFFVLGLCGVLYLPWLDLCNHVLLPAMIQKIEHSFWVRVMPLRMISPLLQCVVLFLVPSIVMGLGFPLMVQAWVDRVHRIGRSIGSAYSANTWGAVAGGLVMGFVCLARLGLQTSMIILGLIVMWAAGLLWFVMATPVKQVWMRRCVWLLAACFVTLQVRHIPGDLFARTIALSGWKQGCEVIDVKEGINTTVSIHRDPRYDEVFLYTSGRMVAGTSRGYRADQKMLGHFPALLHPHARKTLSVGFGTGESTACLAKHEGVEQIDCAEIAPEVVELSLKHFTALNLGRANEDAVNMIYMDARNYLHLTEQRYDVIINDCTSIRGFAENASLYTKDYFDCARQHLNDNGLFISWIDTYATEGRQVIDALLGTMMDAFEHVTLWTMIPEPAPFFVIVGSDQPQRFSVQHLADELDRPQVVQSLQGIHLHNAVDVLSCYIADENDLRRYLNHYHCNTDNQPFIEFATEHRAAGPHVLRRFYETVRSDSLHGHLDWSGVAPEQKERWLCDLVGMQKVATYVLWSQTSTSDMERLYHCTEGLKQCPDNETLRSIQRDTESRLLETGLRCLAAGQGKQAESLVRTLLACTPVSTVTRILQSQIELHRGNEQRALAVARLAVAGAPRDLSAHYNLWSILVAADDAQGALRTLDHAGKMLHTATRQRHLGY